MCTIIQYEYYLHMKILYPCTSTCVRISEASGQTANGFMRSCCGLWPRWLNFRCRSQLVKHFLPSSPWRVSSKRLSAPLSTSKSFRPPPTALRSTTSPFSDPAGEFLGVRWMLKFWPSRRRMLSFRFGPGLAMPMRPIPAT